MTSTPEHDYIRSYERAVEQLSEQPDNRDVQHQAVLSLAQTGALDFALAEYARYGLDNVRNHEDIMALGGRLSKDLFLRTLGSEAIEYARDSAEKYEAAYQSTKGYYSGINAATMAFMADMPDDIISGRALSIIEALPPHEQLTPTDYYFIEATRAESLLLRGDLRYAKLHLKAALAFDPLNYTAHATTIKQFKMILSKRGEPFDWLADYIPPKALHYAGHINLSLSASEYDKLSLSIIDHIQRHDIGFGYGALAAGSDILIAEALLDHGAELHVILPCSKEAFLEHSVQPFGDDWVSRYFACLDRATSTVIMAKNAASPDEFVNRLAGQLAMGQAVLRGRYFSAPALQLLIWNEQKGTSCTALHAQDWESTGREQILVPAARVESGSSVIANSAASPPFIMKRSDNDNIERYENVSEAMEAALKLHSSSQSLQLALHVEIPSEDSSVILQEILQGGTPNSVLMSEAFASLWVLFENNGFDVSFAGVIGSVSGDPVRCYALDA